mgnify:CR=1 FL=1
MKKHIYIAILIVSAFNLSRLNAQQDPQFTQYTYNTMSVNSAYAGTRGHLTVLGLHRSQWVGLEGAPRTQTLSIDSPIGKSRRVGLGLSVVNDEIGPSEEVFMDLNFSYTIPLTESSKVSFGLKGGFRLFSLDFSKGRIRNPDQAFGQVVNNRFLPTAGAGIYFHSKKKYLGVSIPNFFKSDHYNDLKDSLAEERLHIFIIGGWVFDLSENIKFKPAFLVKHVEGAPLSVDLSANFMFLERFRAGVSYRWDDSFSGLVGFQVSKNLLIGYSYDYTTTELQQFTSGSHEITVRFEVFRDKILKSPRFF